MADTYTVKRGDTLSEIAQKYKSTYAPDMTTYQYTNKLKSINNIANANKIYVGQVIKLSLSATPDKAPATNNRQVTIRGFGPLSTAADENTICAWWDWGRAATTDHYHVKWWYLPKGSSHWFVGTDDDSVKVRESTYSFPSNATAVRFSVKPIATTFTFSGKDTYRWTDSEWSTNKVYYASGLPLSKPPVPSVTLNKLKLTVEVNNLTYTGNTKIQFKLVRDDKYNTISSPIAIYSGRAATTFTLSPGCDYKVCCRPIKDGRYGEYCDGYSEIIKTMPNRPVGFSSVKAVGNIVDNQATVELSWKTVKSAESYTIGYAESAEYFTKDPDKVVIVSGIEATTRQISGLAIGKRYYFRLKAKNSGGETDWSTKQNYITIGKKPDPPTTWSSTNSCCIGDIMKLYWIHNSEDDSSQTTAQVYIKLPNGSLAINNVPNDRPYDEKNKASTYSFDTSLFESVFIGYGSSVEWMVKTKGISNEYSDYSIARTFDVYERPELSLSILYQDDIVTSFPIQVHADANVNRQNPLSWHLNIVANDGYEMVDNLGNMTYISKGQEIFSRIINPDKGSITLDEVISAGDISLENNIPYTLNCVVAFDSGLTASGSYDFTVGFSETQLLPDAEIAIDHTNLTALIRPYCVDEDGNRSSVKLSVYRREYDGRFTEIATDIDNSLYKQLFVTDPHPALNIARYRIVAVSETDGSVGYSDIDGIAVGETAIVIQWDETWDSIELGEEDDGASEDTLLERPWTGSMLKLPYNISVSNSVDADVEFIEYIGRKHPVSYYGTQVGETASWSVDIRADDNETIYALRRLSKWMGDVYVREPSGTGYWANVKISFSEKYLDVVIPVTINITRVEGGI